MITGLLVWVVVNLAVVTYASFRDIDERRGASAWMTFGLCFLGVFLIWKDKQEMDKVNRR